MAGTVAQTIQGEAGNNPAGQFAVASVIYNRAQAGNFPGGSDPYAIVNAPQQFIGSASPNANALALESAINNGTLNQYGNPGNAVYFQQTGSNTTLGQNGVDLAGNSFSDRWGAPSENFQLPSYGAAGSTIADGTGGTSGFGGSTVDSTTLPGLGDPGLQSGGMPIGTQGGAGGPIPTGNPLQATQPGQGSQVQVGIQQSLLGDLNKWVGGIANQVGTSFDNAVQNTLGGVLNWASRGFLIVVGIVLVGVALFMLANEGRQKAIIESIKGA